MEIIKKGKKFHQKWNSREKPSVKQVKMEKEELCRILSITRLHFLSVLNCFGIIMKVKQIPCNLLQGRMEAFSAIHLASLA